jgi:hypothetical protein
MLGTFGTKALQMNKVNKINNLIFYFVPNLFQKMPYLFQMFQILKISDGPDLPRQLGTNRINLEQTA